MYAIIKIKDIVKSNTHYIILTKLKRTFKVQENNKQVKIKKTLIYAFHTKYYEKHIQGFSVGDLVKINFFISSEYSISNGLIDYKSKVYIDKIEKHKKKERFVPKENPVQIDGFKENYFESNN